MPVDPPEAPLDTEEPLIAGAARRVVFGEPGTDGQLALTILRGTIFAIPALMVATVASDSVGSDWLSFLLFPLGRLIVGLAGPGINIGTEEEPFIEATPVHLAAALFAMIVTFLQYVAMTTGLLWWIQTKRTA